MRVKQLRSTRAPFSGVHGHAFVAVQSLATYNPGVAARFAITRRGCLCVLLGARQAAAVGTDFFRRVAGKYESIIDYSFVLRTKTTTLDHARKGEIRMTVSLPNRFVCEQRGFNEKPVVMGSDGRRAWAYSGAKQRYVLTDAEGSEIAAHLRLLHDKLVARFCDMDHMGAGISWLSDRKVAGQDCVRVRFDNAGETLWISKQDLLVLKREQKRTVDWAIAKTVSEWRDYRINTDPDPGIFSMPAQPQFTRTNRLPLAVP